MSNWSHKLNSLSLLIRKSMISFIDLHSQADLFWHPFLRATLLESLFS